MKFKTNAKCMGCVQAIRTVLKGIAPSQDWTFDLDSPDKTLTYSGNGNPDAAEIIAAIKDAGFEASQLD